MSSGKYHKCPKCGTLSPWLQMRCACGYQFTGKLFSERRYKTCSACGSLVPATQLFCGCGHVLIFSHRLTKEDLKAAYTQGYAAGMHDAHVQNQEDWDLFFEKAGFRHTVTREPIRTREAFFRWKAEHERLRRGRRD